MIALSAQLPALSCPQARANAAKGGRYPLATRSGRAARLRVAKPVTHLDHTAASSAATKHRRNTPCLKTNALTLTV